MVDVTLPADTSFELPVKEGHTVLAYIFEGEGKFEARGDRTVRAGRVVLFERAGDRLSISASTLGLRCLLIAGRPLGEPVAWYGSMVMNTPAELRQAFEE